MPASSRLSGSRPAGSSTSLAAAIGLSAFVLSSATAFSVVKYAGAAYLVVLGIRRLLERDDARVELRERDLRRIYGQGVVVNVLNPKTALFFFAFLPQFVDVAAGHVTVQLVIFGLVFVVLALVSDSVWALVAGTGAGWLREHLSLQRWVSGGVFIGLGARDRRLGLAPEERAR